MARQGDITIVGGWAETEVGLANRRLAAIVSEGERMTIPGVDFEVEVPWWRNAGLPGGRDLGVWTPRVAGDYTNLPDQTKIRLADMFGVDISAIDNYSLHDD